MAIFCLSNNIQELEEKIGNITVAYSKDKKPIYAKDLKAQGPMTVLLKEAVRPNVVQTLENNLLLFMADLLATNTVVLIPTKQP